MPISPIIVALDHLEFTPLLALVDRLDPLQCRLKVGKELFTRHGPPLLSRLQKQGFDIFLDLKFHDIPHTVTRALQVVAELGIWMVTIHAMGGEEMITAARHTLSTWGDQAPLLIAVTVLTHLEEQDLHVLGVKERIVDQVKRLALLAQRCGVDGVVCSAQEAGSLRGMCGAGFKLVTPGIRPFGSANDDQRRIMTPKQAMVAGANYLVIGRPITQASDPVAVLEHIQRSCC